MPLYFVVLLLVGDNLPLGERTGPRDPLCGESGALRLIVTEATSEDGDWFGGDTPSPAMISESRRIRELANPAQAAAAFWRLKSIFSHWEAGRPTRHSVSWELTRIELDASAE